MYDFENFVEDQKIVRLLVESLDYVQKEDRIFKTLENAYGVKLTTPTARQNLLAMIFVKKRKIEVYKKAILKLAQPYQLVMYLLYVEGRPIKDVQQKTLMSRTTIWRTAKTGKALLAEIIEIDTLTLGT